MKVIQRPVVAAATIATILSTATATAAMVDVAHVSAPSVAQQADPLDLIRSFPTVEHGVSRPTGLVWSAQLGALLVPGDAGTGSTVSSVTPSEDRLGRMRLPAVADADAVAVDPLTGTMTATSGGDLLSYSANGLRTSAPRAVRKSSGAMRLRSPRAMTYDGSGALVVLDGGSLVRRSKTGKVTRVPISGVDAADLRGLTAHPELDLLYSYDASGRDLLGIDLQGRVVESRDAADLDVTEVQGIAFAPSADATDDPAIQNLFVADAGGPGTTGEVVEASLQAAAVAITSAVDGTLVRTTATSAFDPASPDPSGIAYLPGADRLFIADGEVNEMSIFEDVNFYSTSRTGVLDQTGVSLPWSEEPVGVGYNPANNHLFVSDDDLKELFEIVAGNDGRFGTSDDTVTQFDTLDFGLGDPEGVDYDSATNSLWFAGGENSEMWRLRPGNDGTFGTSDDIATQFDSNVFGASDPEGMGYDSVRNTVLLLDDSSDTIYEFDQTGALLNTISTASAGMEAAAGIAVGPASVGSGRNYYVVARGEDNDSHPNENDGRMYEFSANLPPVGDNNAPPVVNAGSDASVILPLTAALDGTVSDDGRPNPPGAVTTMWSELTGPGDVTFGNTSAVDTTASFSSPGTYVLRLTADDGEVLTADDVTITVLPEGSPAAVEVRVAAGSDDVEQAVTSGSVALTSSDLELVTDGNTVQIVGTRFTGVQIPAGAQITNAYVQFQTDEVSTGATSLTIRAENADNPPTYTSASGSVAARPKTTASVAWSPPAWNTVGERGAAQRTPNIASLVQSVVDRPGWNQGNALAIQLNGTGRRTAEPFEGGAAAAPMLHVEYTGGGGTPPVNQPPTVSAGADQSVQLPASASLDGTVTDDGRPVLPGAVTTTWSEVSGPGDVTFGSASAVDTTASFSAAGSYTLRLTANDGELTRTDDVVVTVTPAGGGGGGQTADIPIRANSDDAEQSANGGVNLGSSDLELVTDGNTVQIVGTRFTGVQIPAGAQITNAYVQFQTDQVSTGTAPLTIRAESADNAPTYLSANGNVGTRAKTTASVAWSPPAWNSVGERAAAQRTPSIASLVQEVVNRPGWVQGNALALQYTGTGQRTAEAFESGAVSAAVLHLEWTSGGPPVNLPPTVDAGPDQSVQLPASASLDGTVTDDGLAAPIVTTWSEVTGPGEVTFGDASAVDTTASFSAAGSYTLRLTANDGEFLRTDDVVVTVTPAGGGGGQSADIPIAAGSDDAEERFNGQVLLTSYDLDITTDGSRLMTAVGLRFTGLPVPQGAVITNAYIQFAVDDVGSGAASLTVRAQAADNAPTFTTATGNLSSRATTAGSVAWSPAPWTTVGAAGVDQRTSNLAPILQQVVNRPGWATNNAVALLITGNANRTAMAFEHATDPVLHLEWQ